MAWIGCLASMAWAAPLNGGFESGMAGWTTGYVNDGSNWGATGNALVTDDYYYSGQNALWGAVQIVGDNSYWWEEDWSRAYVWSETTNLTNTTSIQLYLTDFQSNQVHQSWGWGQEIFLVLTDGTTTVSALLVENHEPGYATPQPSVPSIGADGRIWSGFDIALTSQNFGTSITNLNLASAQYGIMWEAINWNSSSQTLYANCAIDDIALVPEPASLALLTVGALVLRRRL